MESWWAESTVPKETLQIFKIKAAIPVEMRNAALPCASMRFPLEKVTPEIASQVQPVRPQLQQLLTSVATKAITTMENGINEGWQIIRKLGFWIPDGVPSIIQFSNFPTTYWPTTMKASNRFCSCLRLELLKIRLKSSEKPYETIFADAICSGIRIHTP